MFTRMWLSSGLERSDNKKGMRGEPGLRGEPTASGAEKFSSGPNSIAVWSAATKEKDGLRKQAVKV